jgi:hypothetical protein
VKNLIFASLILLSGCFDTSSDEPAAKAPSLPDVSTIPAPEPPKAKIPDEKVPDEKVPDEKVPDEKVPDEKVPDEKVPDEKVPDEKVPDEKVPAASKTVGPVSISQGSDDGYSWQSNGAGWVNHALDLENTRFGGADNQSRKYIVSLMFRSIDVPVGAKILSAKFIFTKQTYQNDSGDINLNIEALDPVSSLTFSQGDMAQDRVALSSNVDWTKSSAAVDSPDISTLVQSIIEDDDWRSGGAMSFKISNVLGETGDIRHNIFAYDAVGNNRSPQLLITYEVGGDDPETPPPLPGSRDITLNWQAPNKLVDDVTLINAEIASYTLHWGRSELNLDQQIKLNGNEITRYVFEDMDIGHYYFSISATTVYGAESLLSSVVHKEIK